MARRPKIRVVPKWIFERWIRVAYLIINWDHAAIARVAKIRPSSAFYEMVGKHLAAYEQTGEMPPKAIASAILNLADDRASGNEMTMRAGDYIALQTYMKAGGR